MLRQKKHQQACKVAIAYTVRNEKEILFQNMAVHRRLGISHFFVFWDNTEDNSPNLINHFKDVTARETVSPEELEDTFLIKKFGNQLDNHNARRVFNNTWAARKAKEMGYEWLLCIDPDEIAIVDYRSIKKAQLDTFLNKVPSKVCQVSFTNLECIAQNIRSLDRFSDVRFFVKKYSHFTKWGKYIKSIQGKYLGKGKFFNPYNNLHFKSRFFLGHESGKVAFRLSYLDSFYPTSHRWANKRPGNYIAASTNSLLHYYCFDFKNFKRKFKNYKGRPNTALTGGKYLEHILILRNLVDEWSEDQLWEYYKTHIGKDLKTIPWFIKVMLIRPIVVKKIFNTIPKEELCER